jgi:hypothetical protein
MSTAVMSRRSALRTAVSLLFLHHLTACSSTISTAGASARLIADALIATWWFIVAQVPGLVISEPTQAALTDAFRAINFGGVELSTQMAADPVAVEEFVKGVNVLIGVIVETSAIPLTFSGPTGDPVSSILAAVVTLMPEVEGSFHLSIPVASIERPQPGAAAAPPTLPRTASPTAAKAAEALLTRVAATKPNNVGGRSPIKSGQRTGQGEAHRGADTAGAAGL